MSRARSLSVVTLAPCFKPITVCIWDVERHGRCVFFPMGACLAIARSRRSGPASQAGSMPPQSSATSARRQLERVVGPGWPSGCRGSRDRYHIPAIIAMPGRSVASRGGLCRLDYRTRNGNHSSGGAKGRRGQAMVPRMKYFVERRKGPRVRPVPSLDGTESTGTT